MAAEEEPKVPAVSSWGELLSGGLPQMLLGPAGKSLSRLIAGATEIPAAWLEQKAQAIRDTTEAKSMIMQTLAVKSAELGLNDEALLERGLDNLLGRAYREQENREAVAKLVIEDLKAGEDTEARESPTDDWMNVFEQHAAKATSDQLRETWARVMSGELRQPGSFSLLTMQFLSVLDRQTADAAQRQLGNVIVGRGLRIGQVRGQDFTDLGLLHDAGIVNALSAKDTEITIRIRENGIGAITIGGTVLVLEGAPDAHFKMQLTGISRVARELLPIIDATHTETAFNELVEHLKATGLVNSIARTPYKKGKIDSTTPPVKIWSK